MMEFSSEALENMKVYEFVDNKGDWNMIGLEVLPAGNVRKVDNNSSSNV